MRRFCFILFTLLIIGQAYTSWTNQARWPFHPLYMFIGQYTVQAKKILIEYTSNGFDYSAVQSEQIKPYGYWQLRYNILSKKGQNQLGPFTEYLLRYNKVHNSPVFSKIQKIRISLCEDFLLKNCEVLAESN